MQQQPSRPIRVAIAELKQESNSFAPQATSLAQFEDFHLWRGAELLDHLRETNTEIGGFLDICAEQGWQVEPLLAAFAVSGGPLTTATITALREELLSRLQAVLPVDAVLLALHGAMVAEDDDDPDGTTLAAVRAMIGSDLPLLASLDLHANLTRLMVDAADALVGFRTCPHIDQRETGRRTARLLAGWLAGGPRPQMAMVKLPLITPASTHIHSRPGPFQRLMQAAEAAEQGPILAAGIFTVQPWLDIDELGFATLAVSGGDQAAAAQCARELAARTWVERHALCAIDLVAPEAAIAQALAHSDGPVVLSELADGTGAGSPGDATAALAALLVAAPDRPALCCICDPEVTSMAAQIGAGGAIDCMVGGKRDHRFNRPLRFNGIVERVEPAHYRFGGQGYTGISMDMGMSAVLRQGEVRLLVTSKAVLTVDPALYRVLGLEPAEAQIVVVKSHIQFRAAYEPIARRIILLDTPGVSSDHLATMPFRRAPRPLYPLDPDTDWTDSNETAQPELV